MNTKVHAVITKLATGLCGSLAAQEMSQSIREDIWKEYLQSLEVDEGKYNDFKNTFLFRNYRDLLIFGAYMEDATKYKSDVPDPEVKNELLNWALVDMVGGNYPHWVEHFWNPSFAPDYGLEIKADYINHLVREALGIDKLFGNVGEMIYDVATDWLADVITMICNGDTSTVLGRFRSAPQRAADYWEIAKTQYKSGELEKAYFNLGKICHLIEDMGTPAHVNNDPHAGIHLLQALIDELKKKGVNIDIDLTDHNYATSIDDDQYEAFTGKVIETTLDKMPNYKFLENAMPVKWNVNAEYAHPVYNSKWKMQDYFKDLATYTRKFDSDDVDGSGNSKPMRWQHFNPLSPETYIQRQWDGDLTEYACNLMAEELIPKSICYAAGLIMCFYDEVGASYTSEYPEITFNALEMYVDENGDTFSDSELYLTTQFNEQKKKYGRIISGDKKTHSLSKDKDYEMSALLTNKDNHYVNISSSCEDNDDWWLFGWHVSRDSLGATSRSVDISDMENSGYIRKDGSDTYIYQDSAADYKLTYSLKKTKKAGTKVKYSKYIRAMSRSKLAKFKAYRYVEGDRTESTPIWLNLTTCNRHMATNKFMDCGTWKRADGNSQIKKIYMTESELLRKRKANNLEFIKAFARAKNEQKLLEELDNLKFTDSKLYTCLTPSSEFDKLINAAHPVLAEKDYYKNMDETKFRKVFTCTCGCCK